jgi:hypothetical protein
MVYLGVKPSNPGRPFSFSSKFVKLRSPMPGDTPMTSISRGGPAFAKGCPSSKSSTLNEMNMIFSYKKFPFPSTILEPRF